MAQAPIPLNQLPSRIVGHPPEQFSPMTAAPNLVEGREFWQPRGLAIDTSVSPPRLFVADGLNNRVLGWKNALAFRNGQPADLVVGQNDFFHTTAGGPGTQFSAGVAFPSGVAVDASGNLYVADTANNRILRFPKPFDHLADGSPNQPDLHIGQSRYDSNTANFTGSVSDQGLNFAGASVNLAFDTDGNLWVTDPGNRRVLRFGKTDLGAAVGIDTAPKANLVLGQPDFTTTQTSINKDNLTTADAFATPLGLAFDPDGRLYVSDGTPDYSVGRVLVFTRPFASGQRAVRMLGVFPDNKAPNQDAIDRTWMWLPSATFFFSGKMGVVDTASHRILIFDSFDKWPDTSKTFSPLAIDKFGQPDFHSRSLNGSKSSWVTLNGALDAPDGAGFSGPLAALAYNDMLYVSDTGNNRVLAMPIAGGTITPASGVLGQDRLNSSAANLIEGREFAFTNIVRSSGKAVTVAEGGVTIDETTDTPHLFVADTFNNRVLGFRDFRAAKAGAKADLVIGQPDFASNLCNISGDPSARTASSLCAPTGLVVDSHGDLYVADSGNGRVLRFPAPFARSGQLPQADLVLGQRNFTSRLTDAGQTTMSQPYGLAISGVDGLLVSDVDLNRVLFFQFGQNTSFAAGTDNGRAATKVFGQPDFLSSGTGSMNQPRHIAADADGRVYVADTANKRVLIYTQVNQATTSVVIPVFTLNGLNQPRAVFVNQSSGEIWIADGGTNVLKRYPRYVNLILNSSAPDCNTAGNCVAAGSSALAVTQDQFGDLIVADASNRLQFYFPGIGAYNGAHWLANRQYLAPGMLASLCSPGSSCGASRTNMFGPNTQANTELPTPYPMPNTLGDVQVLFGPSGGDLKPVPLYYVSPSQINFVVPMGAPQSGLVDLQVWQPSTGRIFAAGTTQMTTASPAVLMLTYDGKFRQAAVLNEDGTVNSPQNPAKRGSYVTLYGTGQGYIPGAPSDGVQPSGPLSTPAAPRINLNGTYLEDFIKNSEDKPKDQWLYYSGLCSFPGLWQINFYVPSGVQPTQPNNQVTLIISANNILSVDQSSGFVTTIAVK